jgi:hypothetical protein
VESLFQGLNSKRSDIINIKALKLLLTKFPLRSSSFLCHFSHRKTFYCRCGHKEYDLAWFDRLVPGSFVNVQTAGEKRGCYLWLSPVKCL